MEGASARLPRMKRRHTCLVTPGSPQRFAGTAVPNRRGQATPPVCILRLSANFALMKAIVITGTGGPDVVKLVHDQPVPRRCGLSHHILVACSLPARPRSCSISLRTPSALLFCLTVLLSRAEPLQLLYGCSISHRGGRSVHAAALPWTSSCTFPVAPGAFCAFNPAGAPWPLEGSPEAC